MNTDGSSSEREEIFLLVVSLYSRVLDNALRGVETREVELREGPICAVRLVLVEASVDRAAQVV